MAVGCSTSRTYYMEYDTTDISYVVDSIVSSGTVMGQWKEWRFTLDDGRLRPTEQLGDGMGPALGRWRGEDACTGTTLTCWRRSWELNYQ